MTLREVAYQLHDLSVGGYFAREKRTKRDLYHQFASMFRDVHQDENGVWHGLKLGNRLVHEIALPDGWWYFSITKYADSDDGYDYWIPDTREQSDRLYAELSAKAHPAGAHNTAGERGK